MTKHSPARVPAIEAVSGGSFAAAATAVWLALPGHCDAAVPSLGQRVSVESTRGMSLQGVVDPSDADTEGYADSIKAHLRFLDRMALGADARITAETRDRAKSVWRAAVEGANGPLDVPAAAASEDGGVLYSWDQGRYHVEAIIAPGEATDWFFRDRATEVTWLETASHDSIVPERVRRVLVKLLG